MSGEPSAKKDLARAMLQTVDEAWSVVYDFVQDKIGVDEVEDEEDEEEPFDAEQQCRWLLEKVTFMDMEIGRLRRELDGQRARVTQLEDYARKGEVIAKTAAEIDRLYGFYRDNLQKIIGMFNELERRVDDVENGRQHVCTFRLSGDPCGTKPAGIHVWDFAVGAGDLQEAGAAACDAQANGQGGGSPGAEARGQVAVQPGGGAVPIEPDGQHDVPGTVPGV